jgi:hypothetical protein
MVPVLDRVRPWRAVLGALVALAALALVARAFRGVDLGATMRAVGRVGPLAPLALTPFLAGMCFDAAGMQILLGALGRHVPLARLAAIRIATEALHVTAPAGFLVADSANATLLRAGWGVPLGDGALLAVARKWLVMRAHSVYVVLGAACGAVALAEVSRRHLGGPWLPWAIAGSALVPLGLSVGIGAGLRSGGTLARMHASLSRLLRSASGQRRAHWADQVAAVDTKMASLAHARTATWAAAGAFLGCWLMEALDTAVLVALVGGPADLRLALTAEVGISMLRSIGNVAPAGLGVQDAGYAMLLPALGMHAETVAAFVLLKRGKELVWIATGYTLLAALRRPARRAALAV